VSASHFLSVSVLGAMLVGFFAVLGCSEAVTPNANFDAGPLVDDVDAGDDGVGGVDEPCDQGACHPSPPDLVCIDDGDDLICRIRCDPQANDDPCLIAKTCVALQSDLTQGACVPAGLLDEECPCDEGFACTRINPPDGGAQIERCKTSCDPNVTGPDGGTSNECTGGLTCQAFQSNPNEGVCL
jgi:hypothetical protein